MWNSSQKLSCRLRAMQHSAESSFVVEFNRIAPRIRIYMQNRFRPWIKGPRGTFNEKNRGSKISWYCPFNGPPTVSLYQCTFHPMYSNISSNITFSTSDILSNFKIPRQRQFGHNMFSSTGTLWLVILCQHRWNSTVKTEFSLQVDIRRKLRTYLLFLKHIYFKWITYIQFPAIIKVMHMLYVH
jgi:hypothetical protein